MLPARRLTRQPAGYRWKNKLTKVGIDSALDQSSKWNEPWCDLAGVLMGLDVHVDSCLYPCDFSQETRQCFFVQHSNQSDGSSLLVVAKGCQNL